MKRIFKCSLLFLFGAIIALSATFFVNNTKKETEAPILLSDAITTSASLTTNSEIFSEIKTDGLASYLKISIPFALSTDVKTIVIKQTIGGNTNILTTDEVGTTCSYKNNSSTKILDFYFTRPATYSVYYKTSTTEVNESCDFEPTINTSVVENLRISPDGGQTYNNVKTFGNNFFILNSGEISLPNDSKNLYFFEAESKGTDSPNLLTNIPDNACGTVKYIIKASNLHTRIELNIIVLTTKFSTEFYTLDTGSLINKTDYYFLSSGYCFNEGVKFITQTDANATDLIGTSLTENEIKTIFNYIQFAVEKVDRDETNTNSSGAEIIPIRKTTETSISYEFEETDHSIYTITAYLGNQSSTNLYSNNICKFKIITKIPINEQNSYIFSAILGQGEQNTTNNYIDGVLNGYLRKNSVIYYSASAVRVFNNGYLSTNSKLKYTHNGNDYYIEKGYNKDFTTDSSNAQAQTIQNGDSVRFSNDTLSFNNFFSFSVILKTYSSGYNFRNQMVNSQMYINNNQPVSAAPGENKVISENVTTFKYVVPTTYSTHGIPLHLKVTYNGTEFEDLITFSDDDIIEFFDYGSYLLEFYTIPSFSFLKANLSYLGPTLYYYSVEFNIAGPSIYAETNESKPTTISNNMYTQSSVNCTVNLNPGQKFIAYKNNEVYNTLEESLEFSISDIGTWKIDIVDASGNIIKSLTFTIMDRLYQGFSINTQDEYESLKIFKKISLKPVILEALPEKSSYHILDAGNYRMIMNTKENLPFKLNGTQTSTFTITECQIDFDIAKSYFNIVFVEAKAGSRVSKAIEISAVNGIELQSMEVYKNDKLIQTFTAEQVQNWGTVLDKTFNDNGTYTFKLTDKFGNTYETQIEKYYKVNVALVFLILIILSTIIALVVIIVKSRHKIKVK